ncbi:replication initiation and membrane attachment family protein [Fredinandcohnia quinoae]|uniref:Replication initiation and membrane attachment family protein n=1 Tax=Fredinandcohnia quinoae TaxID=2918902 RepID=A0AAW5E319_9BACI|nr:replication initiation and membrane attachment family protein [Fredinandcohnia sp. SECRCQ15]MCH1627301.1 replication initiation and membrane attachment family protein [Fredinandcohnia sp. SECRCQ15]
MEHWNLLPVDRYQVHTADLLHDYDRKVLTLLYQPLIGSKAYSLYMTLWSELEQNRLWGEENTHHSLMAILQSNLKGIYQERLKLEGIGLLKSYVKLENDSRSFVYELQAPLSPGRFFTDGVLNIYLYNRLGKNKFMKLKRFFSDFELDLETYQPITKTFNEVFVSVKATQMVSNMNEETERSLEIEQDNEYAVRKESTNLTIDDSVFDFDLFFAGISDVMIPKKSITLKVKEAIKKLSFLYGINPIEMQGIVMSALDPTEAIDIEKLRIAARDWYQIENGNELPKLSERLQPVSNRTMMNETPKTKEEELIKQLELVSPKQLLTEISGGAAPSTADLKIVEDVMFRQKLLPGVVNVLIHYVMLRTDMKLTKSYVEKLASHWARKEITTVRAAMELAKQEHRQYQDWATGKKESTTKKKPIRKELLPEWLKQEDGSKEKIERKTHNPAFEEEKRKIEERIKKMSK